ncbi:MAG: SMC-Scp complex subunit ScpB, partial [Thermoguttaceae bacterium]
MNFERTSRTGGPFGSVALRYRQPLCAGLRSGRRYSWQVLSGDPAGDDLAARGPNARTPRVARLEAALLLSQQPQSSRRLAQLAGLADGTKARTLVRALNRLLDSEGCAFRAEEVAGGFQLLSRSKFAPWLRGQRTTPPEVRLSAPAMETLAVVAYRQPVVRAEIEAVRGVLCGEILRQLIERGLVRIAGRAEELGRPFLYGTTKHFLQVFGLRHLDELPRPELFRTEGASKADNELSDQHDDIEEETDVRSTTAVMGQMEQTPEETPAAPLQESEDELFDHDEEDDDEDDEDED